MAKAKAKAKKSPSKAKAVSVTAVAKKPEEIQKVRNKITNVIVDESLEMAKRAMRSVKEGGSVTSLKYLWEVAGLFPAPAGAEEEEDDSLARTLLEGLNLPTNAPLCGDENESDVESE